MDRHFWDDRRFPPEQGAGIIFVDVSPENIDVALRAFGLLYGTFARSFGGYWVNGMKGRACVDRFFLKMISAEGRRVIYEMELRGGYLWARQVYPLEPT